MHDDIQARVNKLCGVLIEVDVMRDIAPHLVETTRGDLVWDGPFDQRNNAPIGDTIFGTRFAPIQVLGVAYEIGLRPHIPPAFTLTTLVTKTGALMRFGSSVPLHPRDLSPWKRRFGTSNMGVKEHLHSCTKKLGKWNKRRVLMMHNGLLRLKESAYVLSGGESVDQQGVEEG